MDLAEAEHFLSLLDSDADIFIFARGDDDKARKKRLIAEAAAAKQPKPSLWEHRRGTLSSSRHWLEERQDAGWGAFVSVQAMQAARCLKKDVAYIRAVFAEMDIEPLKPWPIPPSIEVETSPGRCHVYWVAAIDDPITPEDFDGIEMCLVEAYGADPDSKDRARRLRLPGSWNVKPDRPAHLVRIIRETDARYSRDELLQAFPRPPERAPVGTSVRRPKWNSTKGAPGLDRFVGRNNDGPIWSINPYEYGDWLRVGMALHGETNGSADGLALWDGWSAKSEKWSPGVCAEKWKSFSGSRGITGGTIFAMADERGWTRPIRLMKAAPKVAQRIGGGVQTRHAEPGRSEDEASTTAAGNGDRGDGKGGPPRATTGPCAANEDAIATAFATRYCNELRYCHDWGYWLRWDGIRWCPERTQLAFHYAREMARAANTAEHATPAKASTAKGVERFAQADRLLATEGKAWDRDPWLLATPGGTVALRTGTLRAACRDDKITKSTAVAPVRMPIPTWERFLHEAAAGDEDLIRFLQRMSGYALTADVSEQAMFFFHGAGGNGKGVYLNTTSRIMGDYAVVASMDTFNASKGDRHPTELAMLRGARLVTAQETEEGRAWSEVRIKALTGADPITARFMNRDFFTYEPTFKVVIAGNHKPTLRTVDDAIRRRLNLLPFVHKPATPDPDLTEKLKPEWAGILAWMIEGCLAWQAGGLDPPAVVRTATEAYFQDQDLFAQWLAECCETGPAKCDTTESLFGSWKVWAEHNGDHPGNSKTFAEAMTKAGFEPVKKTPGHTNRRGYKGVRLVPKDTSDQWQNRHES